MKQIMVQKYRDFQSLPMFADQPLLPYGYENIDILQTNFVICRTRVTNTTFYTES